MQHKHDFSTASSDVIIETLCRRLDEIRLTRNITQAELAERAGVSRSTMARIADGKAISLDSFVRVMQALGLEDHLAALLPDPSVRPVDRVQLDGSERQRARQTRTNPEAWSWGDEESHE